MPSSAPASRPRFPRRWSLLKLADRLVGLLPCPAQKRGALLIRLFGIGDALLFRPAVEPLAEALGVAPQDMHILGATAWSPIRQAAYAGLAVTLIDERKFSRNFFYRVKIGAQIRRAGYQAAVCGMGYRAPHVADALVVMSGAPQKIVCAARPNEKFDGMAAHYARQMTRIIGDNPSAGTAPRFMADGTPLPRDHEMRQMQDFISALAGRPLPLDRPRLSRPAGVTPLGLTAGGYILLNLGASYEPRRWPLESFLTLARRFAAAGQDVVLCGGPAEQALSPQVTAGLADMSAADRGRLHLALGSLSFAELLRVLADARLVISGDTGPGHLAMALSVPSLQILGGGHFGSFMPYPPGLEPPDTRFLYQPMPCYHCEWSCPHLKEGAATFPCVAAISAEQVWTAAQELLQAPA